jgi:hypothetical protein
MADRSLDDLGPVDYLIVEFPPDEANFTGEIADAVTKLHDAGTIRVMDIVILVKDADGNLDAHEVSDLENVGEIQRLQAQLVETLAEQDIADLGAAMEPGTIAAVLIYENLWAAPFAAAVRHSGGRLVATGRIPIQALIAAVEADDALVAQEA